MPRMSTIECCAGLLFASFAVSVAVEHLSGHPLIHFAFRRVPSLLYSKTLINISPWPPLPLQPSSRGFTEPVKLRYSRSIVVCPRFQGWHACGNAMDCVEGITRGARSTFECLSSPRNAERRRSSWPSNSFLVQPPSASTEESHVVGRMEPV